MSAIGVWSEEPGCRAPLCGRGRGWSVTRAITVLPPLAGAVAGRDGAVLPPALTAAGAPSSAP
jgi:hypothetical protein